METNSHSVKKRFSLANILLTVVVLLLLIRYSWARSNYLCDLTGRQKIVDRVFFVPVHTTKLETETSRWLDERLGPTKYRMWHRNGFETIIGGPVCACKPIPMYLHQLYKNNPDRADKDSAEMLETLRKARQTISKNTRDAEFAVEE